jgi:hypothetical protein
VDAPEECPGAGARVKKKATMQAGPPKPPSKFTWVGRIDDVHLGHGERADAAKLGQVEAVAHEGTPVQPLHNATQPVPRPQLVVPVLARVYRGGSGGGGALIPPCCRRSRAVAVGGGISGGGGGVGRCGGGGGCGGGSQRHTDADGLGEARDVDAEGEARHARSRQRRRRLERAHRHPCPLPGPVSGFRTRATLGGVRPRHYS